VERGHVPRATRAPVVRGLCVRDGWVERHGPDIMRGPRWDRRCLGSASGVDLSFSAAERAFAAEVRQWLAEHLRPPPPFASSGEEVEWGGRWQATLAAGRWVGIHWPREYGGRGASPLEVAIFNTEYARARAPQPVNRVGINLTGPTLLAHGTDEQK